MPYIPTAPDIKTKVADTIRARRKKASDLNAYIRFGTDRDEAGRYTTVGGALVTVEARVHSSEHRSWAGNVPNGYEQRVEISAVAKCHGNGCPSPDFMKEHSGYWPLDDDADKAADAIVPLVQQAREWAQKHAEKCRAQAYDGR
ncbi:hypothetical protein AB0H07_39075 [Streptomyces sp. NPDC021354]|uniref:hypothetical protein n=1 Tax=Streptomyces sp. NPDC021354 TaxID=3154793 RepID=UPI0033DD0F8A